MIRLTEETETFAARRRSAQHKIEKALRPAVTRALDLSKNTDGWYEVLGQVSKLYSSSYAEESGFYAPPIDRAALDAIHDTLKETDRADQPADATVDRITTWLATVILSLSTMQAALDDPEDLFLEWVDMHDKNVRAAHRDASGQQRPVGEKFDVGGHEMTMPGDSTAPIDLWINCRCTLRPVLASESPLTAAIEHMKGMNYNEVAIFKDYTPKQREDAHTLPDGSFPIEDCADLRNAIQAIGRAKDPAKAKAHIRRRKSALGCPDVDLPDSWSVEGAEMTDLEEQMAARREAINRLAQAMEKPTEPINDEPGKEAPTPEQAVPFHAVLAVENVKTGDGRRFAPGSLSHRPLPLPLTWQKVSADAHGGNVVVGRIEKIKVHEGQQLATGHFIQAAEADEFIGLVAEFGKFGVSIDGDMVVGEVNEDEECVDFTATRTSSACAVPIPALAEAYVSLGEPPEDWPMDEPDEKVEPLVASGIAFKDLAPGRTEDGPGWLTNPVDTDRLRDYWVRGPGAAKIGWGTPGDFNRCRAAVGEYVAPQHLAGYCANRHFDALGFWPGRPVAGDTVPFAHESLELTDTEPAPMFTLTASGGIKAPAEWFANPNFQSGDERLVEQESGGYAVPFTITEEGRVFGHIAHWGSCHINPAFNGYCVDPPRSGTNYAYFRTGAVLLDTGEMAATGVISIGGGHAGERMSARQALAHYDSTSTAAADVACYDDEFGIAVAGWIRPGTSDEMVTALRASKISGDWRPIGAQPLELVAALAVNVPGFGVNRTRIAAGSQGQISLVAAGMVEQSEEHREATADIDISALAYNVALELEGIQMRRAAMAALASRREQD